VRGAVSLAARYTPAMLLALRLMLSVAFAAPVPVQLPASEAANGWAAVLADTGLGLGKVAAGQGVVCVDGGDGATWKVHVVDKTGRGQDLAVLIPTNAQEREDLAWYLAKLAGAEPPPLAPLTPAPMPAPAPVAAAPAPVPAAPAAATPVAASAAPPMPEPITTAKPAKPVKPAPAPKPTPVAATPPVVATPVPSPAPVSAPPAPATSSTKPASKPTSDNGFFARVAFDADVRGQTAVAFTPELALGARVGLFRAGLWGDIRTLAEVPSAGDGRGYSATEFGAEAWIIPSIPVGVGVLGGGSFRSFVSDGAKVATVPVPLVGVEALGHIKLVSHLALEPLVRFSYDLRPVQLQVNGGDTTTLPGWELRVGVGVSWN